MRDMPLLVPKRVLCLLPLLGRTFHVFVKRHEKLSLTNCLLSCTSAPSFRSCTLSVRVLVQTLSKITAVDQDRHMAAALRAATYGC